MTLATAQQELPSSREAGFSWGISSSFEVLADNASAFL